MRCVVILVGNYLLTGMVVVVSYQNGLQCIIKTRTEQINADYFTNSLKA